MSSGGLDYNAITTRRRVTLPSVESWGTNMNIVKDPPKSLFTRRIDKTGDTQQILLAQDDSGDRIAECIQVYARGTNPMVSVQFQNAGNSTSGYSSQAVSLPYKIETFRPPVLRQEDLLPLSRLPRVWFSAYSKPGMQKFIDTRECVDMPNNVLLNPADTIPKYQVQSRCTQNLGDTQRQEHFLELRRTPLLFNHRQAVSDAVLPQHGGSWDHKDPVTADRPLSKTYLNTQKTSGDQSNASHRDFAQRRKSIIPQKRTATARTQKTSSRTHVPVLSTAVSKRYLHDKVLSANTATNPSSAARPSPAETSDALPSFKNATVLAKDVAAPKSRFQTQLLPPPEHDPRKGLHGKSLLPQNVFTKKSSSSDASAKDFVNIPIMPRRNPSVVTTDASAEALSDLRAQGAPFASTPEIIVSKNLSRLEAFKAPKSAGTQGHLREAQDFAPPADPKGSILQETIKTSVHNARVGVGGVGSRNDYSASKVSSVDTTKYCLPHPDVQTAKISDRHYKHFEYKDEPSVFSKLMAKNVTSVNNHSAALMTDDLNYKISSRDANLKPTLNKNQESTKEYFRSSGSSRFSTTSLDKTAPKNSKLEGKEDLYQRLCQIRHHSS